MAITGSDKAYLYALSGVARSGATRSGYVSGLVFVSVGGIQMGHKRTPGAPCIQMDSLVITDELNETPNTCTFRVNGTVPAQGSEVIITLGSTNNSTRLFAGHVLSSTQSYFETPANLRSDVSCVDYTWLFSFEKVTKRYVNQSATVIARDLVSTYAAVNGFTTSNVAADLPSIPEITFTNEDLGEALSRVATRIGGYWYVDYHKDVHLFFTDTGTPPAALVPTHRSLAQVTKDADRTQTLSRVYVEGRGSRLLNAVAVGDTHLPLEAVDMFQVAPDVFAKASFQGASGGAQHITYTGVVVGGGGAIIGPGVAPGGAPDVVGTIGTGAAVTPGGHNYAFTYVTAAGESLPSVIVNIQMAALANPLQAADVGFADDTYVGLHVKGGKYKIQYTYVNRTGGVKETLPSPPSGTAIASNKPGASGGACLFYVPRSTDPSVNELGIYCTTNNGSTFYFSAYWPIPAGSGLIQVQTGSTSDATIVTRPGPPTANTYLQNQVNVSGIAAGPSTVTSRKLYRSVATPPGLTTLKLLATLADNTTTTYVDKLADASLGANAPATDTSGLKQPEGQINPGDTTIRVSSTAPFVAEGGWAVIGNGEQVIRYTGLTSTSLTGVPANGIGAVTAVIVYNSTISAAPMLTGIPASGAYALAQPLTSGDEVYLFVRVDDTARRADLAAAFGGSGNREEWVQDRRLSIPEARARAAATLAQRVLDQVRVTYTCRDLNTRSGKDVVVNLPAPTNIVGTFKIQHVTISNFRPYPTQYPTFTVQASSSRFSFEDLLRVATRDVAR